MKVKMALVVTLVVLGSVLVVPSAQAVDRMTVHRAGNYYLTHACAVSKAINRFNWRIWLGRDWITTREIQRRLPQIKRETRLLVKAERGFATRLRKPPAAWPTEVEQPVKVLGTRINRRASVMNRAAHAHRAQAWIKWMRVSERISAGQQVTMIRDRLGLPASGGCAGR